MSTSLSAPLTYARGHQERFVDELKAFVHFPSVSAQPQHAQDVSQCAVWLERHLQAVGLVCRPS